MAIKNTYALASRGADLLARGDDFPEAQAVRHLIRAHQRLQTSDPELMRDLSDLIDLTAHQYDVIRRAIALLESMAEHPGGV